MAEQSSLKELRKEIPYSIQFALWGLGRWLGGLSKEKRMDLFKKALGYVITLRFLDGYRTQIAGLGAIGLGIYLITEGDAERGVTTILAGLGALGLGGKIDKQTEATNANTLVVAAGDSKVPAVTAQDADKIIRNLPGPVPTEAPPATKN